MMTNKIKFVENDTKVIVNALQEAVQDPDADEDRWLDDGTSDIDTIDGLNYGIENWYKVLLKTLIGG